MARKTGKGYTAGLPWVLLLAAVLAVACGCGKGNTPSASGDVAGNSGYSPEAQGTAGDGKIGQVPGAEAAADFGLRLLRQCMAGADGSRQAPGEALAGQQEPENRVVSPLSLLSALAMAGNGAGGETLAQMEETFGMTVPELSAFLQGWGAGEAAGREKCRLNMANGIWFTEDASFTVEEDFLKACSGSFGAEVRRVPFDASTLKEINGWVEQNTEGMIREILDKIPPDALMYLVNAVAFEGEWERVYREGQVREGKFTQADGTARSVEMMYSSEGEYLQDEHAAGFIKYYAGRQYAYAALLPEEGMDVAGYVASLDGEKLLRILSNPVQAQVQAGIPRYKSEYGAELGDILQEMGMADAFLWDKADFTGIGHSAKGNIYISRVLHRAFIAVDEKGTRAGAAAAVEMESGGALDNDVRTVYLDRPFLYMIVDCETGVPVFMGVLSFV